MSLDENSAAPAMTTPVRRYFEEVHNQRQLAVMDEIFGTNWELESYKQFLSMYFSAFPDLRFTILDQLVAGDKVITRWTMTGHHQGTLQSAIGPIEATGNAVSVSGITIDRVANGRIIERWHEADNLGMLQQLGAIPAPPE